MLFYDFSKKLLKNFFKNYRNIIDKSDKFEILQFVPGCRNLKLHTLCGTANLCCCANIKEKTFFSPNKQCAKYCKQISRYLKPFC